MKIIWYQGQSPDNDRKLTSDRAFPADVLPWINDNLDPDWLADVLKNGKAPPLIIMDNYANIDGIDVGQMFLPLFLHKIIVMFDKNKHADDFTKTEKCFNFTINKKTLNRSLMLKMVEWFDILPHSNYTWSGHGREINMMPILQELSEFEVLVPSDILSFMCSPIEIPDRFFPDKLVKVVDGANLITNRQKGLFCVGYWERWFNDLYSNTAVSLIAEGFSTHRASLFTEKTLWSVMAQTFPIWIGGYGQAQEWQKLGFDTFNDVIDHSYQYQPTLWQRCYMALENNIGILSDIELARSMREKHRKRLQANRDLIFSGVFWQDTIKKISTQPLQLQQPIHVGKQPEPG